MTAEYASSAKPRWAFIQERIDARVEHRENGCIHYIGATDSSGYWQMKIKQRSHLVHRLVWQMNNYEIPSTVLVMHTCDNRRCVNIKHLFVGTKQDNMDDMVAKNRQHRPSGELSGNASINDKTVRAIRELAKAKNPTVIANELNISRQVVYQVLAGRSWSHVS